MVIRDATTSGGSILPRGGVDLRPHTKGYDHVLPSHEVRLFAGVPLSHLAHVALVQGEPRLGLRLRLRRHQRHVARLDAAADAARVQDLLRYPLPAADP